MLRKIVLGFCGVVVVLVVACVGYLWWIFSPSHALEVAGDDREVRLVIDSLNARRLVTLEETNSRDEIPTGEALSRKYGPAGIAERRIHPELYFPMHVRFVNAMKHQPSLQIRAKSYARLLESSTARCEVDPSLSANWVKVRITTGPERGREGLLCFPSDVYWTFDL